MLELTSLGLSPAVLQSLFDQNELGPWSADDKGKQRAFGERPAEDWSAAVASDADLDTGDPSSSHSRTKAVYEVVQDGQHLLPRLRIWVGPRNNSAYVEETEEGSARAGVDIRLDKPDSPEEQRTPLPDGLDEPEISKEELLLVSKPIVPVPGQSLVWSLQRKAIQDQFHSCASSGAATIDLDEPNLQAHPVELVKRQ